MFPVRWSKQKNKKNTQKKHRTESRHWQTLGSLYQCGNKLQAAQQSDRLKLRKILNDTGRALWSSILPNYLNVLSYSGMTMISVNI